jgi:hypothetical protein
MSVRVSRTIPPATKVAHVLLLYQRRGPLSERVFKVLQEDAQAVVELSSKDAVRQGVPARNTAQSNGYF